MANEIDLNDLTIKTDSLPDNWKMMIIDPTTGLPARNMTVARFVELFTQKLPEVTSNNKGLLTAYNYENMITYRGSVTIDQIDNTIMPGMYYHDQKIFEYGARYGCLLVLKTSDICIQIDYPLHSPYQVSFRSGHNVRVGQTPIWEAGGTWYKLLAGTFASTSANILTDTISDNYSFIPPPLQIACQTTQNQLVQRSKLRYPLCRKQTTWMVQLQLIQNRRNSMSGQLTRSEKLSWNYRKKTRDLNKSSISLTIARYNKCNLPRAEPPRLIN